MFLVILLYTFFKKCLLQKKTNANDGSSLIMKTKFNPPYIERREINNMGISTEIKLGTFIYNSVIN